MTDRKELAELLLSEYENGLVGPIVWQYVSKEHIEADEEKIDDEEWAAFVDHAQDHLAGEFGQNVYESWHDRQDFMGDYYDDDGKFYPNGDAPQEEGQE